MAIIQRAGHALAIGLDWAFVSDQAEARKRVRLDRQRRYLVVAAGDDGLLLGLEANRPRNVRGRSMAGSRLVGLLLRDAIVYEELGPGQIWVCATHNGLPLPGMDRIASPEEAEQMLADVRSWSQAPAMLVGSHPQSSQGLDQLLEQVEPMQLRDSRLQDPADRQRTIFYLLLVFAFSLAAYVLWRVFSAEPVVPAQSASTALLRPGLSEEEIRRRDAALIDKARREMLSRPASGPVLAAWRTVVRELPYGVGGYRPRLIECLADGCRVEWDWQAARFDEADYVRLPGLRVPGTAPSATQPRAQTRITFAKAPPRRLEGIASAAFDEWSVTLGALARRTGARIDLPSARQAINVTLPPVAEKRPARQQLIGHEGRVTILLSGWAAIQVLFDRLDSEPLWPERAMLNLNNGNVTLQLELRYVLLPD